MPAPIGSTPTFNALVQLQGGQATTPTAPAEPATGAGVGAAGGKAPPVSRMKVVDPGKMLALLPKGDMPSSLDNTEANFEKAARSPGTDPAIQRTIDLAATGDTASFIAKVMVKQFGNQLRQDQNDKLSDSQAARAQELDAAASMKDQAKKMEKAAITGLVVGLGAAGLSMAGTLVGVSREIKAIKSELKPMQREAGELKNLIKDGESLTKGGMGSARLTRSVHEAKTRLNELEKRIEPLEKKLNKFEITAKTLESASKGAEAGAGYVSKTNESQSKEAEADQHVDQAQAEAYDAQADIKKSTAEGLQQLIQQCIEFVKTIQETKNDMMAAITRG